jgi:hypothetical protein
MVGGEVGWGGKVGGRAAGLSAAGWGRTSRRTSRPPTWRAYGQAHGALVPLEAHSGMEIIRHVLTARFDLGHSHCPRCCPLARGTALGFASCCSARSRLGSGYNLGPWRAGL